jgi:2,3-bisphosphoglycerate-independent phosphoglycerate mutase
MKCLVVAAGGLADEPLTEGGGKAPLEIARTPNLDLMSSRGILGLTRTVPRGPAPGNDLGTMALLGYDPERFYCGLAPLAAAGQGVTLGPDEVAICCQLVTFDQDVSGVEILSDPTGGRLTMEEERTLLADLGPALGSDAFVLRPGPGHRHLLVWRGGERGVRTTPPHEVTSKPVAARLPEGRGADVLRGVMERAKGVLSGHPLCAGRRSRGEAAPNGLWLWGLGTRATLPSFRDRFHVDGTVVSRADFVHGLGRLAGMNVVDVPEPAAAVDLALRALGEHDFVFLGAEIGDFPTESGKPSDAIEQFDDRVVGQALAGLRAIGDDWRLMVIPPTKRHTAEPVPFTVYVARDEAKDRGASRGFSERDAREFGIFIPEAHTLLDRLLRR